MIRGKKGIELTVNFLVTLIISLVIFGLGVYIFAKFIGNAEEIQNSVDEETLDEMRGVIFAASDEVLVYPGSLKINAGKNGVFGIGVLNIQTGTSFYVTRGISSCYELDGATLLDNQNECGDHVKIIGEKEKNIPQNERQIFEQLVTVEKDAPAGIYPITVTIFYGEDEEISQKVVYVTVP